MNPLQMKTLRVRRAARVPGGPDALHDLEWLGGEALVAPLPLFARIGETGQRIDSRLRNDVHDDREWLAL